MNRETQWRLGSPTHQLPPTATTVAAGTSTRSRARLRRCWPAAGRQPQPTVAVRLLRRRRAVVLPCRRLLVEAADKGLCHSGCRRRNARRRHASGGAPPLPLRVSAASVGCGSSAGCAIVLSSPKAPPTRYATTTTTNTTIPTAGGGCAPNGSLRRLSRAKSAKASSPARSASTPR